jgi:hypothetical protein
MHYSTTSLSLITVWRNHYHHHHHRIIDIITAPKKEAANMNVPNVK